MDEYKNIMCSDLARLPLKTKVRITGVISKKMRPPKRILLFVTDITGTVMVSVDREPLGNQAPLLKVGRRVRIYGYINRDQKESKIISDVEKIESIAEIGNSDDIDILDQEALLLTSRISNQIRNELVNYQFEEITTRVISRYLGEEILEPLLVKFPGFGTEAYLSPSPSSQLSEFLTVTLLPKVFTETVSFTTSYRFKNASSEMPLIMAKAINMPEDTAQAIIIGITRSIFKILLDQSVNIKYVSGDWTETLENNNDRTKAYTYGVYKANIPVVGQKWNSLVETIVRLTDAEGNILVEGTREVISENATISTFSFYPTQYLNIVQKVPRRILQNLWTTYDGGKLYD